MAFIENLNHKLKEKSNCYDYNYYDFMDELLTDKEKQTIIKLYETKPELKKLLQQILMNTDLAIYKDYQWIAKFLKDRLEENKKISFINNLNNYFTKLKNYHIKNQMPKVNVLITIYLLNDYNDNEIVNSLIKNVKYIDYVIYIIENTKNKRKLYEIFKFKIEHHEYKNKYGISNVFLEFSKQFNFDDEAYMEYLYYDFLLEKNKESLDLLIKYDSSNKYIKKIRDEIKNQYLLEMFYASLNEVENLYNLLKQQNKDYGFIKYIDVLKNTYSQQLYELFHKRVYEILEKKAGRSAYKDATNYIRYILKLDNGEELVNNLIYELHQSKHSKKYTLFEEINKIKK